VVVALKPNATLTREQVRGIVHLVCHSIEGLKPEHVTVVDAEARPLWQGGDQYAVDNELLRTRREANAPTPKNCAANSSNISTACWDLTNPA
jgi:flagellar biosynthesis/type III secretory pathway M-ring protein FliF/YscJ